MGQYIQNTESRMDSLCAEPDSISRSTHTILGHSVASLPCCRPLEPSVCTFFLSAHRHSPLESELHWPFVSVCPIHEN
jgi:hypothetical protein